MKNQIIKLLLKIFRVLIHANKDPGRFPKRILVVATTALGDTLWATPAIESLRKSFPRSFISILTSPIGMEIFKYNPYIDDLHQLKEPVLPHLYSLWKTLWNLQFDTILIFHASQRLTLPFCAALGVQTIVGTAGLNKGLDSLLTNPLPQQKEHEIVRRLNIVAQIGATGHSETLTFFLQPHERQPKRSGFWIMIHPGAKDAFKHWPWQSFAKTGLALQQRLGAEILITGTQAEKPLMQRVADQIPGAHLADAHLPLRQFAALIEQMDLLICNDTGPFHLACALNKPVVGIFAATDPILCGPHKSQNAIAITKKTCCSPCIKRQCRDPFCQLQIAPCEVIDAALKLVL